MKYNSKLLNLQKDDNKLSDIIGNIENLSNEERDKLLADGRKNVISLIGKASNNSTTCRNYLTVLKTDEPFNLIGDVNRNGIVTIEDATLLQRYLAEYMNSNGEPLFDINDEQQKKLTDANKDGHISIKDVTTIQLIVAEIILPETSQN